MAGGISAGLAVGAVIALYLRRRSSLSSQGLQPTFRGGANNDTPSTSLMFGAYSTGGGSTTSSLASLPTAEGDDADAWDSGGMQQHAKQYNHREISTHEAL